jgi:tRNA (cmo5U34)-methyltransferase
VEHDINSPIDFRRPSVVIMNWTLQFVRPLYRDTVIRSIYHQLAHQGCLILMEKTWLIFAEEALDAATQ